MMGPRASFSWKKRQKEFEIAFLFSFPGWPDNCLEGFCRIGIWCTTCVLNSGRIKMRIGIWQKKLAR